MHIILHQTVILSNISVQTSYVIGVTAYVFIAKGLSIHYKSVLNYITPC